MIFMLEPKPQLAPMLANLDVEMLETVQGLVKQLLCPQPLRDQLQLVRLCFFAAPFPCFFLGGGVAFRTFLFVFFCSIWFGCLGILGMLFSALDNATKRWMMSRKRYTLCIIVVVGVGVVLVLLEQTMEASGQPWPYILQYVYNSWYIVVSNSIYSST